ncbi:MAG: hypothetical protein KDA88_16055 [Planctomycetaceae bacterium]|nr:hypothetical protein [Planctomycetaceae bacterium]MCB9953316.1 hypothetical protein [Planctomycetaceae bacterium]
MFTSKLPLLLLSATCIAMASGCGGPDVKLDHVSGTVTFDGKPVPYGQIQFVPNKQHDQSGPAGSAEIVDGKFSTENGGKGLVFGSYSVRITAFSAKPPQTEGESAEEAAVTPLFTGYEMEMDVWESELTIDVPKEAEGFDIYKARQKDPNSV